MIRTMDNMTPANSSLQRCELTVTQRERQELQMKSSESHSQVAKGVAKIIIICKYTTHSGLKINPTQNTK